MDGRLNEGEEGRRLGEGGETGVDEWAGWQANERVHFEFFRRSMGGILGIRITLSMSIGSCVTVLLLHRVHCGRTRVVWGGRG